MASILRIRFALGALLLSLTVASGLERAGATPSQPEAHILTEVEAVVRAEQFIADEGYTLAPPKPESIAFTPPYPGVTLDQVLASRRDMLVPEAYGLVSRKKDGTAGWLVVFEYTDRFLRDLYADMDDKACRRLVSRQKVGRAVTMDPYGNDVGLVDPDFILKKVEKRLRWD